MELPKGEHTVVRVSPTISMTALLSYICEKRNLPVEVHCFDLPATEESLANKTLQELKINSIRVISTGVCVCGCVCVWGCGVCGGVCVCCMCVLYTPLVLKILLFGTFLVGYQIKLVT